MASHLVIILDLFPYLPIVSIQTHSNSTQLIPLNQENGVHVLDSVISFAKSHSLLNEKSGLTVIGSLLNQR